MIGHTLGPWEVMPEEEGKDYVRIRGTRLGGRYKIANVSALKYAGVHPQEAAETRANVQLIAAAPDLLEALTKLYERCSKELSDPEDVHEMHLAQFAITKAIS